jgi:hypothetical protein
MANLKSIKPSISEMSYADAQALVMASRQRRRARPVKAAPKRKGKIQVDMKKPLSVKSLDPDMKKALLAMLLEDKGK